MKKLLVLVPVFLAAACIDIQIDVDKTANADDSLGSTGSSNGSRLTRQYLLGIDGSRMETEKWLDSELGIECEFQQNEDSVHRCLPKYTRANKYADSACTKPIHVESYSANGFTCHKFQGYVRFGHEYANGCNGDVTIGMEMYRVDHGSLMETGATLVWYEKNSAKECTQKSETVNGIEFAKFGVTKIGDANAFVSATKGQ